MYILDKNNLLDDIIQDDVRFQETTYLLLIEKQLQVDEIEDYYAQYHKQFDIQKLEQTIEQMTSYYDHLDERGLKASQSSFMRYFFKDIKKKFSFKGISQNFTKKMISMFVAEIIEQCCYLTYQNLFRERYMEFFSVSVDKDHLHDEFFNVMIKMLTPLLNGETHKLNDRDYAFFQIYKKYHALYIVEFNQDNPSLEKLEKYKEDIHYLLSLSEEDIIKKADEVEKQFNQKHEDLKLLISNLKNKDNEQKTTSSQNIETLINDDYYEYMYSDKPYLKKLEKIYMSYFDNDKGHLEDYIQNIYSKSRLLYKYKQNAHLEFYIYALMIFIDVEDMDIDYVDKDSVYNQLEVEQNYDTAVEQCYHFTYLLAYHLWHRFDVQKRQERINAFHSIMKEIPECYEFFLAMNDKDEESEKNKYNYFHFTPRDYYYNRIVISVLFKLASPQVQRRVKRLILKDYDHYDLCQMSKKYSEEYENNIDDHDLLKMNQMADLFVLSYMKDRECVAPYSPYVRYFQTVYPVLKAILKPYSENDDNEDQNIKDERKRVFDIIDNMIQHCEQCETPDFHSLTFTLYHVQTVPEYFSPLENKRILLQKYKEQLANYIRVEGIEKFLEMSLDEQVDKCLCVSFLFSMIQEIDSYEEWMPTKQAIQNQDHVDSLKQIIQEQKQIIELKDQQLENEKHKSHPSSNQPKNNILEQELQYYKQQVSSLNKIISKQEQDISKLKENQEELYKLREVIFQMNQETHDEIIHHVNLQSVIQEKTIIVIGGHIALRNKIKQKYPSIKVLAQASHVTDSVLINADHVFMFYHFMTHDMYNRAISVLTKNHIPWDYIPYTNLEKSEELMYNILSSKEGY